MTSGDPISMLPEHCFAPGSEVISEGVIPSGLFFLKSGRVEVVRGGNRIALVKTPGSVLGEMSVLLGTAATATVVAIDEAVFHVAADALEFLRTHPEVHLHVSRTLAHRLDAASQYLVDVKEQLKDCSDHVGMVDGVLDAIFHRDLKRKVSG